MIRGSGSGYRPSSRFMRSQDIRLRCERRSSHRRHNRLVSCQKRAIATKFPVIPKYP